MRLWLDRSKQGVDPFSPENPLILTVGPTAGTVWPTGGNGHVLISKSLKASELANQNPTDTLVQSEEVKCRLFHGYLKKRPKNTPIPDECLICSRMIECLAY